ncbi:MAG TPA: hypothetical protein VGM00_00110 [Bradyrhizobium sp.]
MRGSDCRSLAVVAKPGPPRRARAAAGIDVEASIAIVVRSSTTMSQACCEPFDLQKVASPVIEHGQRQPHGPRSGRDGQQIIPGDVKAAYQRRPRTEQTHQLDLLV